MNIIDIHTHILPEVPGTALVCIGCGPIPNAYGNRFSVGLHPWDVTVDFENQLVVIEQLIANPLVLAVGECGFDTLKGPSHELQEKAFIRQVEFSERFGKPMILHVVRDFDSVIRLRRTLKPVQPWLIHGFRGGPKQMNQLLSNGLQVSFGLRNNPESLLQVPSDRLFVETDGTGNIDQVISLAANLRGVAPDVVTSQVVSNVNCLLSGAVGK